MKRSARSAGAWGVGMAKVVVRPLPQKCREISPQWRPSHPPIFPDGPPSAQDIELARALFRELDDESKDWYGRAGIFAGLP